MRQHPPALETVKEYSSMSIYTYNSAKQFCEILNIEFQESIAVSDQELYKIPEDADTSCNEASKRMLDIARLTANNEKRARNISIAKTGKKYGEEYSSIRKISCAHINKGENNPMFGRKHSKKNLLKMKKSSSNRKWYNDGEREIFIKEKEVPVGFNLGRLFKKRNRAKL